jgi:SAM-dependent methyltransferase
MVRGLLISHKGDHCGVYQFGRGLWETLVKGGGIEWFYAECSNLDEAKVAIEQFRPDVVLYNHHPMTMEWATHAPLKALGPVAIGLVHQVHQKLVDTAELDPFEYLICLDPTLVPRNPRILRMPRFVAETPLIAPPAPDVFTVGSFGFATPIKGFDRLCARVSAEFDRAIVRLNLPPHGDPKVIPQMMFDAVVDSCRQAITKRGVELVITHEFWDNAGILKFLAANTMNAFLYDDAPAFGISSCTDFALASGRPFALTRSSMFRNYFHINPSIFIEDRSLKEIACGGTDMLRQARENLAPERAGAEWNRTILNAVAAADARHATPDHRGYNKILDDRSRKAYSAALCDLERYAPEMISRKIARANIQQAFALETAYRFLETIDNPRIIAAGSFEDTTVEALKAQGFRIDAIDPNENGMTLLDFYLSPEAQLGSYDLALSVSVLEHVEDDERFVRLISEFLRPGGLAILTVDFAEKWRPGLKKPEVDHRLYTTKDICERLMPAIGDCVLVDPPSWRDGVEDFEYEGAHYGFGGFVFRKLTPDVLGAYAPTPVWRELLAESNAGKKKKWSRGGDKMTALRRLFALRD